MILKYISEFDNINIYIERGNHQYEKIGRIHTEEEAKYLDGELVKCLNRYNIEYKIFKSGEIEEMIKLLGIKPIGNRTTSPHSKM